MNKINFKLETDYIHLIQLLKATNLVPSGGIAKLIVEDGLVKYNGEVDYRKRLKVKQGDLIEYENHIIEVV